ncbi:MAG TPA: M23 family metallopeptidase [Thermoanaerobaculia bacterium]|nr:M23 family metallopeptidase [Thermoanaerobaculia bacterium]
MTTPAPREAWAGPPPPRRRLASRVGLVAYLAFLVFGLAVTPRAVGDLLHRGELPQARLTRDRIGHRLATLRDEFILLAEGVDEQRRRVEKIRIAYGLAASMEPLPVSRVDPSSFPSSIFLPQIEETATLATRMRLAIVELEAKVAGLRAFEAATPERVAFTPALSPLYGEFVVTSSFGYRKSAFTKADEYHSGVDLAAAVGTPVLAPADGRVVFVGKFPVARDSTWWRLGDVVALRHGEELLSIYGHLGRTKVRRGQSVTRGEVLAEIGESGVIAHPHLHYAVWRRGTVGGTERAFEPIDPRLVMLDRQWDDEEELLANAAAAPQSFEYEPLPRQLR